MGDLNAVRGVGPCGVRKHWGSCGWSGGPRLAGPQGLPQGVQGSLQGARGNHRKGTFGKVTGGRPVEWRQGGSTREEGRTGDMASCLSPTQEKLAELQAGKKSLEDQVEMLRLVKEEAEKPEKEAKDQHQKRWEGMSRAGQGWPLSLAGKRLGPGAPLITCWLVCLLTVDHGASVPHALCWPHLCIGHCI